MKDTPLKGLGKGSKRINSSFQYILFFDNIGLESSK